jgi:hypothetical protein
MVQPTIQVLLDDASNGGTFPYDITSYVRLTDQVEVTRGRGNEFDEIQPSTFKATLENLDGRFTLGSTVGSYGGALNTDRRIQYKLTANGVTTTRFTGYVQNWPAEWPDGSDQFAVAQITAVDLLARLARKTLRSIIEEEYLIDAPSAYYTLGEPAGATSANDTSGRTGPSLGLAGTGSAVVFGTATGPGTDSLTAAQFSNGMFLAKASGIQTIEGFFSTTTLPASSGYLWQYVVGVASLSITDVHIDATGKLHGVAQGGVDISTSGSVADGLTHHFAFVPSSFFTPTWSLYLDGSLVGSAVGSSLGGGGSTWVGQGFTGVLAHLANPLATPGLSAARVAAHATAGLTGFAGERSDQRISRLANYGGATVQALEVGVDASVPFVDITGASPLAAMNDVGKAEGGAVFIRGDGTLVMQNRQHRSLQTAPDLTMTNNEVDPASQVVGDMQLVQNVVTASAGANGAVQVAANASSRTTHGDYPVDLTGLLVGSDALALNAAQWRVTKYAEPFKRMPDLGFDLATLTAAQQASVMAVEISDRIQITGMPAQAITTTLDLLVEGWTETLGADSWTWQANTSNFATEAAWVLDSPTYSVLDSTTVLSY